MMPGTFVVLIIVLILSVVFMYFLANYSNVKAYELVQQSVRTLGSLFPDLSKLFKR